MSDEDEAKANYERVLELAAQSLLELHELELHELELHELAQSNDPTVREAVRRGLRQRGLPETFDGSDL